MESDLRNRMQPLKDMLENIIDQLHAVFETQVFIIICRGFWDRMGQVDARYYLIAMSKTFPRFTFFLLTEFPFLISGRAKVFGGQKR